MENYMHWLPVILTALVPMIVGFIYYHPNVAGSFWMKANGFTMESMKAPKPVLYGAALVLSVLLAMWLSVNVEGPRQDLAPDGSGFSFLHGIEHGLILVFHVLLPVLGTMAIFEKKSWQWLVVNLGYWCITLSIMAGILSIWR